jgi:hypothetical protein
MNLTISNYTTFKEYEFSIHKSFIQQLNKQKKIRINQQIQQILTKLMKRRIMFSINISTFHLNK